MVMVMVMVMTTAAMITVIMMVMMLVFFVVMTAAAVVIMVMMVVMLVFFVVMAAAAVVIMVMMVVMLMLFVAVTAAAMIIVVMMVMMLVFFMVMTAAAVVIMVMVVVTAMLMMVMLMLLFHLGQFFRQSLFALHSSNKLFASQLAPRGGNQCCIRIMFPNQRNGGIQLCLGNRIRTGQDNGGSSLDLVIIELTEVLHIDLNLAGIGNCYGIAQSHIRAGNLLHRANDIG